MVKWFGKGCIHQYCKWEDDEVSGGPDYRESMPVLVYCDHAGNPEETEGNCREDICSDDLNKIAEEALEPSTGPYTDIVYEARMPMPSVGQEYPVVVKKYKDSQGHRCTKFMAICMSAEKNEEDANLIAKALNEHQYRCVHTIACTCPEGAGKLRCPIHRH